MRDLSRLFRPLSIAVIGGGAWGRAVLRRLSRAGYAGDIWPVHPTAASLEGCPAFPSVAALPAAPDAAFIGVNRHASVEAVEALAARGAGGAVCFASGFKEAQAEDDTGTDLQARLVAAAGTMPILGPNCYGFINYLDGALLWPDQHGGSRVESGVAIVAQSSNILINLTMQMRGLPVAYAVAAGNQAQTGLAEIGAALLEDPRVTALGLHVEGVGAPQALEALAARARNLGKPIVALKVGRSAEAQAATVSHTASLAGTDAGAQALLDRLGIARVDDLPAFLETLKLLHFAGPLAGNTIATISCSGGEASLAADAAMACGLRFPPLNVDQKSELRAVLGPRVALANPLDYHTYIWRDVEAMSRTFAAVAAGDAALTLAIVDLPRADRCDPSDWECAIAATIAARRKTQSPVGFVATLPELLPEPVAQRLAEAGVVPMHGLREAMVAARAAAWIGAQSSRPAAAPLTPPTAGGAALRSLTEARAKDHLAAFGLDVPKRRSADSPEAAARAAEALGFPVALKGEGFAHKTEAGAVALGLGSTQAVLEAARAMPARAFLVEEMITGGVAELLVGVTRDDAHGLVLTLGAGGVLAELVADTRSMLLPVSRQDIAEALAALRIAPLLAGYRGRPPAAIEPVIEAVLALQAYVLSAPQGLVECEVNPLVCTPTRAVAVDALIRRDDAQGDCP